MIRLHNRKNLKYNTQKIWKCELMIYQIEFSCYFDTIFHLHVWNSKGTQVLISVSAACVVNSVWYRFSLCQVLSAEKEQIHVVEGRYTVFRVITFKCFNLHTYFFLSFTCKFKMKIWYKCQFCLWSMVQRTYYS